LATEADRAAIQEAFEMLQVVHKGDAILEWIDNIRTASQAVRNRRKPAKVTLTISFTPPTTQDEDIIHVSVQTGVKLPPVQRGEATWFLWADGSMKRTRELQGSMWDDDKPRLVSVTVIRQGEDENLADDRRFADGR
jgi:hypothetical protein